MISIYLYTISDTGVLRITISHFRAYVLRFLNVRVMISDIDV